MSKERLERIEHSAERTALLTKPPQPLVTISDSDFEWLIEQVERLQELEEIKSDAIKQIDVTQRRNERLEERVQELEEENKRIRQMKYHEAYEQGKFDTNMKVWYELPELEQLNKRYREALEWFSENSPHGNIADEALEGEV